VGRGGIRESILNITYCSGHMETKNIM
jgi:hypothetical protein